MSHPIGMGGYDPANNKVLQILSEIDKETGGDGAPRNPLVLLWEDGGPGAQERIIHKLNDSVIPEVPKEVLDEFGDDFSFHITIHHRTECPSKEDRDQDECTCSSVIVEAVLMNQFQTLVVEKMQQYDEFVHLGEDGVIEGGGADTGISEFIEKIMRDHRRDGGEPPADAN